MMKRNRLTEIFGGTPGPRLALAQGEAALSAQETPHPCPACGRARSSQPPFTPGLEVDAAKECPRTPLCCSSPELNAPKASTQLGKSSATPKRSHLQVIWADASPCSQSENQRCAAEERKARGEGRASERWALHSGWGGSSLSLRPNPMVELRSENWDTLTWSWNGSLQEKVLRSPIFL